MFLLGETQEDLRGRNHAMGLADGLIETMNRARRLRFRAFQKHHIGSVDPDASKIPARRPDYSLAESALSPVQAEPAHRSTRKAAY
jgi:hypothetical protein